jgi:hypothetical protein
MARLLELFSGTGSVGRVFKERGWEVLSLDLDPKSDADLHMDVMDFDFRAYPRSYFQCVWASPPCVQYSVARTNAKTPRDLEGADALVQRVKDIAAHFNDAAWWVENPWTGLLKGRPVVEGMPFYTLDYCAYGTEYRKRTCLWSNVKGADFIMCDKRCTGWTGTGHRATAQRGPGKKQLKDGIPDRCTLDQLHAIPARLVEDVEDATRRFLRMAP